jgi:hypothetical protein
VIARSGFIALPVFIENIPVSCFPLFFQAVSNAEKPFLSFRTSRFARFALLGETQR